MVSQPRPAIIEKSPFYELSEKYKVEIAYKPFIRVVGVSLKEFRAQRVEILTHTAVIFITVPETMKYICQTEAVALYLQKYIVYRKRKISFADGSFTSFIELIIKHKDEKFLLALYSPSDVKTLVEKFGTENLPAVAVFGEGTLRAALDAGITVLANAPTPEAPSMVKAIDIYLNKVQKGEEIAPVELITDTQKEEFIRSQQHKLAKKSRARRPAEPRK